MALNSNLKKIIKKLSPWIFTAIIFGFLFKSIPAAGVIQSIKLANLPLFVTYSVLYFAVMMLIDCLGLQWALKRFSASVSFGETILMRGATYLLMLVNYNAGQGAMSLYLHKTHGAPVFKTLGTVFFISMIDMSILLGPAVITALNVNIEFEGKPLNHLILKAGLLTYSIFILWILFWKLLKSPSGSFFLQQKWIRFFYEKPLFDTFKEADWVDYVKIITLRIPPLLLVAGSFFFWSHSFGIPLPLTDIFVYSPIILIAGTLPITPGGVGAVQALCIKLFQDQTTSQMPTNSLVSAAQTILAASLLWGMANAVLKLLFGLYCLSKKSRTLFIDDSKTS